MDVIYTRANLIRIAKLLECRKQLHVALGRLNGDDVSIETLDGWEDVIEVGVAEMRVSLRRILNTSCCELERVDSPA